MTSAERSARMARIRGRHSKPEMLVRRMIHALGFRYRLHDKRLPGSPDLVFRSRRKVIFIHGCFWHRHPAPSCKLARMPKSRLDFWQPKLRANRERDLKKQQELEALGWKFLVVWECELSDLEQAESKVRAFLEERGR